MAVQYQVNTTNNQGVIKKLIQAFTEEDLFIAIPATVMNVDDYEDLQVVSVKPSIDLIFEEYDDAEIISNIIKKVFVKLPSAGGFSMTWPIAVGDLVTLQWSHRDLGDFLDGSGDDISQSRHEVANIEDCWVEVGFGTRKNNQNPSATDLVLKSDNMKITITPDGAITEEFSGTSYIKSSLHTIDTDTTVTGNLDFATSSTNGIAGVTGVFASQYGSITITNGIITAIA